MPHENQFPDLTDEDTTVDRDRDVHQFPNDNLDADDCYEMRTEFENIGLIDLAARMDIERGNVLAYDGYEVELTAEEAVSVSMALNSAVHARKQEGREDRLGVIEEIAEKMIEIIEQNMEEVPVEPDRGEE